MMVLIKISLIMLPNTQNESPTNDPLKINMDIIVLHE